MQDDAQPTALSRIMNKHRILLGGGLIGIALVIIIGTFLPLYFQDIGYYYSTLFRQPASVDTGSKEQSVQSVKGDVIVPKNTDFGIVIPKIRANSVIHEGIDWRDSQVYQKALQTGIAQAEGTSTPDKPGNMFLFAHSGVDFYEAIRYNAEFYLLNKLEQGDEIDVFYKNQKYLYAVRETKIVASDEVDYLTKQWNQKTVTLMTCWPPGTTYKRLIVIADQIPQDK